MEFPVAEKSWLTCVTVVGVVILPSNLFRIARIKDLKILGFFFLFC